MNQPRTRNLTMNCISTFVMLTLAAPALAQTLDPGDVVLARRDGRIITGAVTLGGTSQFPVHVFPGVFGELPNWTNDPGFDSESGAFPPGTQIGFDAMRAVRVWDGCAFRMIPEERLVFRKGPFTATTPTMDVVTPGFVLGEANVGGVFHHHMSYELLAPAAAGIYLVELTMWSQTPGLDPSRPIWIVFRQGEDFVAHQEAFDWAVWNLDPSICRPDLDTSTGAGTLDIFDFLTFSNLFAMQDPRADFEADCIFDIFDFLAFSNEFAGGCP